MKFIKNLLLLVIVAGFTQCCKEKPTNSNDIPGLPPASQVGANTFGFLLNGQPWVPSGNKGSGNNLSIDYDPGIRDGIIGINAYKVISSSSSDEHFGLGYWNLNSTTTPAVINLINTTKSICYFLTTNNCWLVSSYQDVTVLGDLYIDKYDKVSRIIAGRFNFRLEKLGYATIDISKGRFDFKF